jgi:hypothetical protein
MDRNKSPATEVRDQKAKTAVAHSLFFVPVRNIEKYADSWLLRPAAMFRVADSVRDFGVQQPTEWEGIGN